MTVRLVTNPDSDAEFGRIAEQLSTDARTPEELEERLREHYQRARVVPGVRDITDRWYVYRDGRWVNSKDR